MNPSAPLPPPARLAGTVMVSSRRYETPLSLAVCPAIAGLRRRVPPDLGLSDDSGLRRHRALDHRRGFLARENSAFSIIWMFGWSIFIRRTVQSEPDRIVPPSRQQNHSIINSTAARAFSLLRRDRFRYTFRGIEARCPLFASMPRQFSPLRPRRTGRHRLLIHHCHLSITPSLHHSITPSLPGPGRLAFPLARAPASRSPLLP